MVDHNISRCKSTQHPDNVYPPFFAQNGLLSGEDEIKEAFFAFSHLKIGEQLWDAEGKETDNYVIKKLLTRYEPFFKKNVLGKENVLSFRIPNPAIEKNEAKILLEALYSITRGYDLARVFYGQDTPAPIVDVYVPMVSCAQDVLRIKAFYDEYIIKEQEKTLPDGTRIKDWIGEFGPKEIRVIPLVEDKESILGSDAIAREIIEETNPEFIRFWFARSDPALNYGNPATVLMLKVALQRLHKLENELGIPIYPSLGCGSAPFRGNLRPDNVKTILAGYPSMQTFTIQSSFKYDHPIEEVQQAVKIINSTKRSNPLPVDEDKLLPLIEKLQTAYKQEVELLAPLVNRMSSHIPQRRLRKMHVGLFGYARSSGKVHLPRAIKFTASLYSIGLPPELLSLSVLTDEDLVVLRSAWNNFDSDLQDAMQYANPDAWDILPQLVRERLLQVVERFPASINTAHKKVTSIIVDHFKNQQFDLVKENVVRAGMIRKFLG